LIELRKLRGSHWVRFASIVPHPFARFVPDAPSPPKVRTCSIRPVVSCALDWTAAETVRTLDSSWNPPVAGSVATRPVVRASELSAR
jgi:hypothetical protein